MFEIGWTEMLVIAAVMIVVVGPKDLPRMLRTFGRMTAKLRGMAGDFQKQFNDAIKEAELDDVKKSVDQLRSLNPANEIRKQLNPFEKAAADVRAGIDAAFKPAPKPQALPDTHTAEPLKGNGIDPALPASGPAPMPAAPVFPAAGEPASTASAPSTTTLPAEAMPLAAPAAPAEAARRSASTGAARVRKAPATSAAETLNGAAGLSNGSPDAPEWSAKTTGGSAPALNGSGAAHSGAGPTQPAGADAPVRQPRQRRTAAKPSADGVAAIADSASAEKPAVRPRGGRKNAGPLP